MTDLPKVSNAVDVLKCRTCLHDSSQYHHLEDHIENNYKILEMLDEIVPQIHIRISSHFSQVVCSICVNKLLNGYKFQQLCIASTKQLEGMLTHDGEGNERQLENDSLMYEGECFQIKYEQDYNVNFECKIEPKDITENLQTSCAGKSDDETGYDDIGKNDYNVKFECKIEPEDIGENLQTSCAGKSDDEREYDGVEKNNYNVNFECKIEPEEFTENLQTGCAGRIDDERGYNDIGKDDSDSRKRKKKISKHILTCNLCGRSFDRSDSYRRHSLVHDEKRPMGCSICNFRFDSEKHYIAHMTMHGMETNEQNNSLPLTCALCQKGFEQTALFIQHIRTHRKTNNITKKKVVKKNVKSTKKYQSRIMSDESNTNEQAKGQDLLAVLSSKLQHSMESEDEGRKPNIGDREIEETKNTCDCDNGTDHCSGKDCPYRVKRQKFVHSLERTNDNLLKISMIKHTDENEGNSTKEYQPNGFKCLDCPRHFETHASYTAHSQIHALKKSEGDYPCTMCQINFFSERALIGHILNRHPELEKHKCDQCDATFVLYDHLEEHLKQHKGKKNHVCSICKKEFGYEKTLKAHMRMHSIEGTFLCSQCGKTFKTRDSLKQHMKRHIGLKKYQCSECPSRFNCRSGLNKHKITHSKIKPYECNVCGSLFKRPYSLQKHKTLHTGERPYKCGQCDLSFILNDQLQRHLRTHTGERPYKCKYCDRAFTESGVLTRHLRTHVGENTYMCEQCPSTFKYYSELRQHVSEHYQTSHMEKMSEEPESLEKKNKK